MSKLLLPALLATLALAAPSNTTGSLSLFIPGADPQSLVASAIATSSAITTFLIACPTGTGSSNCGFSEPFTLVEGPSTVSYAYSQPANSFTQTIQCEITATEAAACTATQEGGNMPGTQTYTVASPTYMPVSLVAADWAFAAAVGGGRAGNGTAGAAGRNGTVTSATLTQGVGVGATGSATGSASGSASTAAAPRMTGMAGFGGAIAVAALAAVAM